jgi:alpha-beta hydrolase superfamily lysophospholipase
LGLAVALVHARADRPDLRAMLPDVAVPTAVAVGADDDFTPVAEAAGIAELIPGAELAVIDDAAHLPNLEQPAAFDAALDRLLTRVSCVKNGAGTPFPTHDPHGVDRRRTSHPAAPASTASSSG